MASGLSAVCATCRKYWEGRDKGLPGTRCTSRSRCGSPLAGDDFHEYDGLMGTALDSWCFVCGVKSDYGVRVKGHVRVIGICKAHLPMLRELRPVDKLLAPPPIEVRTEEGKLVSLKPPPEKKSVAKAIFEVESYYAAKEGRKPDL